MTVTNGYTTVSQLASLCQISSAVDDPILEVAINAASRMIDNYCGWRFWQDTTVVARTFEPCDEDELDLMDYPSGDGISTAVGLIVKLDQSGDGTYETTLTATTDYVLKPSNALLEYPQRPYTMIALTRTYAFAKARDNRPTVEVTAKWGWPAIPDDVTAACLLISRDLYKEVKSAPFGVADFGGEGPLRIGVNRTARTLLDPYRKPAVG